MKFLFVVIVLFISFSCERETSDEIDNRYSQSLLLDSVYMYAKDIYLWNTSLPSLEEHRKKYNIQDYNALWGAFNDILYNELLNISLYAKNPSTNLSYEYNIAKPNYPKYSTFSINSTSLKSTIQLNYDNNFGIVFGYSSIDGMRVQYILPDSPADKGGLTRGCKVLEVNGVVPACSSSFMNQLELMLNESRIELKIESKNGVRNYFLLSKKYTPDPILKTDIINTGNLKYGYISYLRFLNSSQSVNRLDDIFLTFDYEKIDKLIIDLRYNSGGSIAVVDKIANYIIPRANDGKVMRYELYNDLMQSGKAEILKNQHNGESSLFDHDYSLGNNCYKYNKSGNLDVDKVYFIISERTASASELLISILRPYISTELIGVSFDEKGFVRSYGKPVGSIDININNYTFYLPMFYNLNGNMDGYYFDGFKADYIVSDDLASDWGTLEDAAIRSILSHSKFNTERKNTIVQLNNWDYQPIAIKDELQQ